jgi:hypothetical protein
MKARQDLGWWYWAATVILLASYLSGWSTGIYLAILLCFIQIGHVVWLTKSASAFPVQVRVTYVLMLAAGLWESLQWIHWVQLVGTSARVSVGYCFLARSLSLAPWNRWQPITWGLVRRTYFAMQMTVPPCAAVFRRMSFERVNG